MSNAEDKVQALRNITLFHLNQIKWQGQGERSLIGQFVLKRIHFNVVVSQVRIKVSIKSPRINIQGLIVLEGEEGTALSAKLWDDYVEGQADLVFKELGDTVTTYAKR